MDPNTQDAKEKLGSYCWNLIMENVDSGTLDQNHMWNLAYGLGKKVGGNQVGGNHKRRTQDERQSCDRKEMSRIFGDWWTMEDGLETLPQETAVKKIIDLLRDPDIGLNPLAKALEKCLNSGAGENSSGGADVGGAGSDGATPGGDVPSKNAGTSISAGGAINITAGGGVSIYGDQASVKVTKIQGDLKKVGGNMTTTTSRDTIGNNATATNVSGDRVVAHNKPPPQLAHLFTAAQKEKQREFFKDLKDEALITIQNGSAQSIISMSKVLSSVCMIECGGSGATGFLVSVGEEIAFMTAGHVFSDKKREDKYGERVLLPNIDWSQYNLYFCCVDGDKNGSQVVHRTLADFNQMFTLRGSIAYMGTRRTFPGRVRATSKDITVESNLDFCVLVLDNPDAKETLKGLKLSWLQCGQGDYLNYRPGDVVSIFGYPGKGATVNMLRPLRMSYGKEEEPPAAGSDFLYYDNDTLPGNSGSPVIGRGSKDGDYAVKGIHIRGDVRINTAQALQKLKDWI